jgi:hypothetical protein
VRAPVTPNTPVALGGVVRGLTDVSLEAQAADGTWTTAGAVAPAADGSFTVRVTPKATTSYRLATGDVRGALIKVRVKPA